MAWLTLVGSMVWGRGCLDIVLICLGLKIWFIDLVSCYECVGEEYQFREGL